MLKENQLNGANTFLVIENWSVWDSSADGNYIESTGGYSEILALSNGNNDLVKYGAIEIDDKNGPDYPIGHNVDRLRFLVAYRGGVSNNGVMKIIKLNI